MFIICQNSEKSINIILPKKCANKYIGSLIFVKNMSEKNIKISSKMCINSICTNKSNNDIIVRPLNYCIIVLIDETTYLTLT